MSLATVRSPHDINLDIYRIISKPSVIDALLTLLCRLMGSFDEVREREEDRWADIAVDNILGLGVTICAAEGTWHMFGGA
jgi:hypothetical protein